MCERNLTTINALTNHKKRYYNPVALFLLCQVAVASSLACGFLTSSQALDAQSWFVRVPPPSCRQKYSTSA